MALPRCDTWPHAVKMPIRWAVAQLWLFWVAPIVGAVLGATVYRFIGAEQK